MDQAISVLEALFGKTPIGWYTGVTVPTHVSYWLNFRKLNMTVITMVMIYLFWSRLTNENGQTRPHLIIPYTLESDRYEVLFAWWFQQW